MADHSDSGSLHESAGYHSPAWRIFRIMSEFVEGFEFLSHIHKCVTVFGSARLHASHPYYELARQVGRQLAERGYTVVTGGGPGLMQAANQGACDVGGDSVGLNIQLPHEQRTNPFVRRSMSFHYFFSRKVMLDFSADAYVFLPGGFGTLDELTETLTLIQTGKIRKVPVVLVHEPFWRDLLAWFRGTLVSECTISPEDMDLMQIIDEPDAVVEAIFNFYEKRGFEPSVEEREMLMNL